MRCMRCRRAVGAMPLQLLVPRICGGSMLASRPRLDRSSAIILGAGACALVGASLVSFMEPMEPDEDQSLPQQWKESLTGEYENRLRRYSNPDKVFEYFASLEDEQTGEWFMSPEDFLRSVTPYSPITRSRVGSMNPKFRYAAHKDRADPSTRQAYVRLLQRTQEGDASAARESLRLRHEGIIDRASHWAVVRQLGTTIPVMAKTQRDVLLEECGAGIEDSDIQRWLAMDAEEENLRRLLDADEDGVLSFGEYVLLLTLLSLPISQFDVAFRLFDEDGNGSVDAMEFRNMIESLRVRNSHGRQVRDVTLLGQPLGRLETGSMRRDFFGDDGKGRLTPEKFREFVLQLQEAVRKFEFAKLDVDDSGHVSSLEFATFLVTYVPSRKASEFWERLCRNMPEARTERCEIGSDDYSRFIVLLRHLDDLDVRASCSSGTSVRGRFLVFVAAFTTLLFRFGELQRALDAAAWQAGTDGVSPDVFQRGASVVLHALGVLEGSNDRPFTDQLVRDAGPNVLNGEMHLLQKPRSSVLAVACVILQIRTLFAMFDANNDGFLQRNEFVKVLQARASRGLRRERDSGALRFLERVIECAKEHILQVE